MTPRIVNPTIADRFINEVPRFFGGWLPTLREIFQNAFRAGATEVRVTSDATHTVLTIADNGHGCPDVAALMTIGRSDWDENQVVEAAGLGFISVLNGALIERVVARSANWRAEWKCQPKALAPAKVYEAEPVPGFSLTLTLKQQHTDLADDIQRARAFYPFTVTFNGVIVEAQAVEYDILFETPVGRVLWKQGSYTDPVSYTAIWEYRDLKSEAFAHALHTAFHEQPREIRAAYDHFDVDDFSTVTVQWENCENGPGTYPTLETESSYDLLVRTDRAIPIRPSDAETLGNWLVLNDQVRGLRVGGDDRDVKASEAVKIVGQKRKPGSQIATAQRITWQGVDLPFYLNPQARLSEDTGQPLIALTGGARQMLQTYRT
ncbi:hypothetical protein ANRL4_01886 [Anaerolineae bacterium]|nr:hypothetical protein ANRL4_01886 [Anaerolineae bacterium]